MARVRMYHAGSDRFQHASAAAFERDYQFEGWVLVPEEEAPAEPVPAPEPVAEVADEVADDAPARGRARKP